MTDYSNSIIYKLCCKDSNVKEIYIGSTYNYTYRKDHHKSECINSNSEHHNTPVYKFIREYGGWSNWEIERERKEASERYHDKKVELNTPVKCVCGLMITKQNLTKHKKSIKHNKRMMDLSDGKELDDTPKNKARKSELDKTETLLGMSQQRLGAANQARDKATQSLVSGVGSFAGGVGAAAAAGGKMDGGGDGFLTDVTKGLGF